MNNRYELGLGSAGPNGICLKDARETAAQARRLLNAGTHPMTVIGGHARAKADLTTPTFGALAADYVRAHKSKFQNDKQVAQIAGSNATRQAGADQSPALVPERDPTEA